MEAKEILRRVKYVRDRHYFYGEETVAKDCEALDKAIAAVKKTIPQKVKRDPFGVECPNCGGRVVLPSTYTFSSKFNNNMIDVPTFNNNRVGIRCDCCYSCGQALDWSEE